MTRPARSDRPDNPALPDASEPSADSTDTPSNGLDGRGSEQSGAEQTVDRIEGAAQLRVEFVQRIRHDEHPVARKDLVVRAGGPPARDPPPIDRKDLILGAAGRGRTGDPDLLRGDRREAADLRDPVEDGLVPGDRQADDLLASAGEIAFEAS